MSTTLLQLPQDIFDRFDRDRSGKIDLSELREALMSLGFAVSPVVLDLLVSKFDKTGGKSRAIEYDNFIEYVLSTVTLFRLLAGESDALLFHSFHTCIFKLQILIFFLCVLLTNFISFFQFLLGAVLQSR